jgi:hypothetical protein
MNENEVLISTESKPEIRQPQTGLRSTLSWLLIVLMAFGLGALIFTVALYLPTLNKLENANALLTEKSSIVTNLQAGNKTLQDNLDSTSLQMHLLKALSGVRGASLAVAADDYAGANLSLTQAAEALDLLSSLIGTDQKEALTAMQASAAQALTEIKTDLKSVQPELNLLTKNLLLLEDNFALNSLGQISNYYPHKVTPRTESEKSPDD